LFHEEILTEFLLYLTEFPGYFPITPLHPGLVLIPGPKSHHPPLPLGKRARGQNQQPSEKLPVSDLAGLLAAPATLWHVSCIEGDVGIGHPGLFQLAILARTETPSIGVSATQPNPFAL